MIAAGRHRVRIHSPRMAGLRGLGLWLAVCVVGFAGCTQEMAEQPRYDPLEPSAFFDDGRSARHLIPGTVARGFLHLEEHLYTGRVAGELMDSLPFALTRQLLARGQERYDIYCAPCHDRIGNGQGMVVRRGFSPPPSFHSERLRQLPMGHFFIVMTNGYGTMPDYAAQVPPHDRWAVAAYIRALQLSQYAALADLSEGERRRLEDIR
jgi:Cytochrome C oxidase, cbb3-type, subunit III